MISLDLESFCITMATLLDFSKILLSRDVTGLAKHVHVRFRSDPSRNRDGVRARGHKPYCFYSMIWSPILSINRKVTEGDDIIILLCIRSSGLISKF